MWVGCADVAVAWAGWGTSSLDSGGRRSGCGVGVMNGLPLCPAARLVQQNIAKLPVMQAL